MKRKFWTSIVIDLGKTMSADDGRRLSYAREILDIIMSSKATKEDEAVGVVLVGSGSFNRRNFDHIVEYGSLNDDRQPISLAPPDANMLRLIHALGNGVHGDLGQALCIAVESITSDPMYDPSTCTARVLVCTDGEGPTEARLVEAAVTDAKGAVITVDLLLVDPKHSNATAVADAAGSTASMGISGAEEEPDPSAPAQSHTHSQDHDNGHGHGHGHQKKGKAAKSGSIAAGAGDAAGGSKPTHRKVHTVDTLVRACQATGGKFTTIDEDGNAEPSVYDIIAPPRAPSGKKPFAPLTLAGKPIAYVTVYGLVMEAKTTAGKMVSEDAALGARTQDQTGASASAGQSDAAAGSADVMTAAGITKDVVCVRDLTRKEKEALEQAGEAGQEGQGDAALTAVDMAARQVPEEDLERVYLYGSSEIPLSATLEQTMKLPRGEAELEILSFVPLARFPRYLYMGSPYVIAPVQPAGKVNEGMRIQGQVQLEALTKAMASQGKGCLIRHRHNASTDPSLYLGIPCHPTGFATSNAAGTASASLGENPVSSQGDTAGSAAAASSASQPYSSAWSPSSGVDPSLPMKPGELAAPAYEHTPPQSPLRDGLPAMIMVQIPWNEDIRSEYIFKQPFTRLPLGTGAAGVPDLRARTAATSSAQRQAATHAMPEAAQAQLDAMDSLIDAMDLPSLPMYEGRGLQPERLLNPKLLAKGRSFAARAIDPHAPLLGPHELVLRYTDPRVVWRDAGPAFPRALNAVTTAFGLENKKSSKLVAERADSVLANDTALQLGIQSVSGRKREREEGGKGGRRKDGRRGEEDEDAFEGEGEVEDPRQPAAQNEGAGAGAGDGKRSSSGGLLTGFLGGLRPAPGQEGGQARKMRIGTGTPVLDFRQALAQHESSSSSSSASVELSMDAVTTGYMQDLANVALRLARDPQELDIEKALACLTELRSACLGRKHIEQAIALYNSTLRTFKAEQGPAGPGHSGRRVWRRFCSIHSSGTPLGLITVSEAPEAGALGVDGAEAEAFLAAAPAPAAAAPKPPSAPVAADDDDIEFD